MRAFSHGAALANSQQTMAITNDSLCRVQPPTDGRVCGLREAPSRSFSRSLSATIGGGGGGVIDALQWTRRRPTDRPSVRCEMSEETPLDQVAAPACCLTCVGDILSQFVARPRARTMPADHCLQCPSVALRAVVSSTAAGGRWPKRASSRRMGFRSLHFPPPRRTTDRRPVSSSTSSSAAACPRAERRPQCVEALGALLGASLDRNATADAAGLTLIEQQQQRQQPRAGEPRRGPEEKETGERQQAASSSSSSCPACLGSLVAAPDRH